MRMLFWLLANLAIVGTMLGAGEAGASGSAAVEIRRGSGAPDLSLHSGALAEADRSVAAVSKFLSIVAATGESGDDVVIAPALAPMRSPGGGDLRPLPLHAGCIGPCDLGFQQRAPPLGASAA